MAVCRGTRLYSFLDFPTNPSKTASENVSISRCRTKYKIFLMVSYLHIEEKSSEAVMVGLRAHSALFCLSMSLKRLVRAARLKPIRYSVHKYNRMRTLSGLFRPLHHIPGERGSGGLPEDAAPPSSASRGCSRTQANILKGTVS
jgi:hypothetical protein